MRSIERAAEILADGCRRCGPGHALLLTSELGDVRIEQRHGPVQHLLLLRALGLLLEEANR